MIKILHVVLSLQVGGLEKFVLDLANNYNTDTKPFIVCLEGNGDLGQHNGHIDIIELGKNPGLNFNVIRELVNLIKEFDIDIIHTHNPSPHFYGAIAGLLARRPVVHTKHGRNYLMNARKVWLNRFSSVLTDKVIAVSQDSADVCLKVEKIAPSKVAVILNGTDTDRFSPAGSDADRDGLPVRIGIVARLAAEKDHQCLLRACKLLVAERADFHLDIIGHGPLRCHLEQFAQLLGIDSYVSFLGVRHDVPALLRQLDIFALSSISEGISLTLLEAMATGLPIVATSVGGNPEVVVDGETGFLVPPQNPEEMASKLLTLINDKHIRRHMGEKGRERVIARFSIKETSRKYQELYFSILDKVWS